MALRCIVTIWTFRARSLQCICGWGWLGFQKGVRVARPFWSFLRQWEKGHKEKNKYWTRLELED